MTSIPRAITPYAFHAALVAAGVIRDGEYISRIVIDAQVSQPVRMYIERLGDERLLDVAVSLQGVEVTATEPALPVRYWVACETALLDDADLPSTLEEAGLRIAELGPWRDARTRMIRIEDPEAPAELDGQEIELILERAEGCPAYVRERRPQPGRLAPVGTAGVLYHHDDSNGEHP
jgi:hypothetical protein